MKGPASPACPAVATGVIVLSPEPWAGLPTNKHQLAMRFARLVPTLYVNGAGRSVIKVLRAALAGQRHRVLWQPGERLWCLEPVVLPTTLAYHSVSATRINGWLVHRAARRAIKRLALQRSVSFLYSPMFVQSMGKIDELVSVYHCVDHYSSFPGWSCRVRAWMVAAETELLAVADIVITTSAALTEQCRGVRPDVVELTNVADYELFATASSPGPIPDDISSVKKPIMFFHGALSSYKVDLALMEALALSRLDWSFVLVGPRGDLGDAEAIFRRIIALPNVHWLGPRKQEELPAYLRGADVLLLPYVVTEHTRHVFPLKFFEYLATGKPIVSSRLEALTDYADLVLIADGPREWENMIAMAIRSNLTTKSRRDEVARANTWEVRVQSIRDLLIAQASVVVG